MLSIATALAGCSLKRLQNEGAGLAPADYFPIALGSVWKFEGHGDEFAQFERRVTHKSGNRAQLEDASGTVSAGVYVISPDEGRRVVRVAEF